MLLVKCFVSLTPHLNGNRGGGVKNPDARDPTFDPNFKTTSERSADVHVCRKLNNMFFFSNVSHVQHVPFKMKCTTMSLSN